MKRILAILALMSVVLVWPMSAIADEPADAQQGEEQAIELPDDARYQDDVETDQNDANGDPHELGGGFRGTGTPCGSVPIPPIWIGPVATLIMHLV